MNVLTTVLTQVCIKLIW